MIIAIPHANIRDIKTICGMFYQVVTGMYGLNYEQRPCYAESFSVDGVNQCPTPFVLEAIQPTENGTVYDLAWEFQAPYGGNIYVVVKDNRDVANAIMTLVAAQLKLPTIDVAEKDDEICSGCAKWRKAYSRGTKPGVVLAPPNPFGTSESIISKLGNGPDTSLIPQN